MKYLRALMMGSLVFMVAACANLSHGNAGKGVAGDYILVGDPGVFIQLRLNASGTLELFSPVNEIYLTGLWEKKDYRLIVEFTESLGGELAGDRGEFMIKGDRLVSVEERDGQRTYFSKCFFGNDRPAQDVAGSYILREGFPKRFAQLLLYADGTFKKYIRITEATTHGWEFPSVYEGAGTWEKDGEQLVLAVTRKEEGVELTDNQFKLKIKGGHLFWMDPEFGRIDYSRCASWRS